MARWDARPGTAEHCQMVQMGHLNSSNPVTRFVARQVVATTEFRADFHPHPDPRHVMRCYRRHILGCKKRWGTARGLIHYRAMVATYKNAKRCILSSGAEK